MNLNDIYKNLVFLHKRNTKVKDKDICIFKLYIIFLNILYKQYNNSIEFISKKDIKKINSIYKTILKNYKKINPVNVYHIKYKNIVDILHHKLEELRIPYDYVLKKDEKIPDIIKNKIDDIKVWDNNSIINILKDNIKKLEGPVSYYLLKPTQKMNDILGREGSVMMLFGDWHDGNIRCKKGCDIKKGCYTFYNDPIPSIIKLINKIGEKIKVDFFEEFWYNKEFRETIKDNKNINDIIPINAKQRHISSLYDMEKYLFQCLSYKDEMKSKCKEEIKFYVHMSDPRKIKINYSLDGNIFILIQQLNYKQFVNEIKNMYPNIIIIELLDLLYNRIILGLDKFIEKYLYTNDIIKKYSRIYKQINKLPEELKEIILLYIKTIVKIETYEQPIKEDLLYYDDEITEEQKYYIIKELLVDNLNINDIENMNLFGFLSTLDLYFLGRSLKIPNGGNSSKLTIGYFGDSHILSIKKFLIDNELYTVEKIFNERIDPENDDAYTYRKCIWK